MLNTIAPKKILAHNAKETVNQMKAAKVPWFVTKQLKRLEMTTKPQFQAVLDWITPRQIGVFIPTILNRRAMKMLKRRAIA